MKILIVEDEEKLAKALKEGLEKEGFTADFVLDGEAGQRRIELYHNDYDLIILDLILPKKDGLTVLKNIREQSIVTPILVLTAKDTTDDIVSGLNRGADDYLVKPFSFKEFFARIKALLRRPKQSLPIELKVRDLTLNIVTKKVFRNGKEILLTLKEFSLLEYLMRHPNQVMSREQILFNLWGFEFDSFSNVVDVHIKNLRKKIDYSNQEKLLETIRGVGYRIKG
ncbi:response regulator transcription factor [Patescibacteria group bacterium]|nr:response regulator transcription factor [Patescibacteria group bacterium]